MKQIKLLVWLFVIGGLLYFGYINMESEQAIPSQDSLVQDSVIVDTLVVDTLKTDTL